MILSANAFYGMPLCVPDRINWILVLAAWVLVIVGMAIGYGAHP